jgi:hypothetical protein
MQCTKPKTTFLQLDVYWDNQIKVWDANTGKLQHIMRGHRTLGCLICPHPTLPHVVITGANDGLICAWDVQRGELLSKTSMVAPDGASTVLDCQFIPEGTGPSTLIGVDSIGRVLMLGDAAEDIFAAAPPSQFTTLDYAPLIRDAYDNVLDQASQLPPHFFNLPLADAQGAVYAVQPTRTQDFRSSMGRNGGSSDKDVLSKWAQWMRGQLANFHARVELYVPLWVEIGECEDNARRHFAPMVQLQDAAMEDAKLHDIEVSNMQKQIVEENRVQRNSTRGAGGTTSGGMLGAAAVYHAGAAAGTPRESVAQAAAVAEAAAERAAAHARAGRIRNMRGLLACERDVVEHNSEADDDSGSSGSEGGGANTVVLANLGVQGRQRRAGSSSSSSSRSNMAKRGRDGGRGRATACGMSSRARSRSSSRVGWDMDDDDADVTFVSGNEGSSEEEETI